MSRIAAARREVAEHEKGSGAKTPFHDAVGGRTVEKVSPHHDLLNDGIGLVAACAASVSEPCAIKTYVSKSEPE